MEFWVSLRRVSFYKQKNNTVGIYIDGQINKIDNTNTTADPNFFDTKINDVKSFKLQVDSEDITDHCWLPKADFAVFRVVGKETHPLGQRHKNGDLLVASSVTKCELFKDTSLSLTKSNTLAQ